MGGCDHTSPLSYTKAKNGSEDKVHGLKLLSDSSSFTPSLFILASKKLKKRAIKTDKSPSTGF